MRVEYAKGERASNELILLHRQTWEATSGRKIRIQNRR
jgi:anaerobic magnesium-protoporphyrin IX monomethyl ester cyclase